MSFRRSTIGITAILFGFSMSLASAQHDKLGSGNSSDAAMSKNKGGQTSASDKKFMIGAAQGGMAEVELGHLAIKHGKSNTVKHFAQQMIDDHTKANETLMQLASQKHVTLPKTLNAKDKAVKSHLAKLSGASFDQAYISDMVKDHQQDVAEFQKEADQGKDPAVKSFASNTLPTLKMHLTMAQSAKDGKEMPMNSSGEKGTAKEGAGATKQ